LNRDQIVKNITIYYSNNKIIIEIKTIMYRGSVAVIYSVKNHRGRGLGRVPIRKKINSNYNILFSAFCNVR